MNPQHRRLVEGTLEASEETARETRKIGFVTHEHDPLFALGGETPREGRSVTTRGHVAEDGDRPSSLIELGHDRYDLGGLHSSDEGTRNDVHRFLTRVHEEPCDGSD